jgi:Alr-MurF fusion protein
MSLVHETILHINLSALGRNFHYLKNKLHKDTQTIAVVKAFAYGLGDIEISHHLEKLGVDCFWVADFEEGVSLRKSGITKPIIIANPGSKSFQQIKKHQLEPVIYNARLLDIYGQYQSELSIHLKFNTGMNRYGFEEEDLDLVINKLAEYPHLKVKSVCSHLAASDEEKKDDYTNKQVVKFNRICTQLHATVKSFNRHILNSNGVLRFPEHQMEMVRLGIGLLGVSGDERLEQIGQFESCVAQTRQIKKGEKVGYHNSFVASKDMQIAVVPVGYADGLNRKLGEGNGSVLIQGKACPILGHVSMDSFITDISNLKVQEGNVVTIFSPEFSVKKLAKDLGTIPYEILATLNRRIKRVYFQE